MPAQTSADSKGSGLTFSSGATPSTSAPSGGDAASGNPRRGRRGPALRPISQAQREACRRHRQKTKDNMGFLEQQVAEAQRTVAALQAQQAALLEKERTLNAAVEASAAHQRALNIMFGQLGIADGLVGGPSAARRAGSADSGAAASGGGASAGREGCANSQGSAFDTPAPRQPVGQGQWFDANAASRSSSAAAVEGSGHSASGAGLQPDGDTLMRSLSLPREPSNASRQSSHAEELEAVTQVHLRTLRKQLETPDDVAAGVQRANAERLAPELCAAFRQYVQDAVPLFNAPPGDELAKMRLDTITQGFLDLNLVWIGKARVRFAHLMALNMSTGVLGEPWEGHWQSAALALSTVLPPQLVADCSALLDVYRPKQHAAAAAAARLAARLVEHRPEERNTNVLHTPAMMNRKTSDSQVLEGLERALRLEQAAVTELYYAVRCQLSGAQLAALFINSYPWYPDLGAIFDALHGLVAATPPPQPAESSGVWTPV